MKKYSCCKKSIIIIQLALVLVMLIIPVKTYAASIIGTGSNSVATGGSETIDNAVKGADSFLNEGKNFSVDSTELKNTSNFIYNILLGISMIIAVIVGMILGIKYMSAGSEDKAAIKETLVPYLISCFLIFGAFTIWKFIINVLS